MSAHIPTPWHCVAEPMYGHVNIYGKGRKRGQRNQLVAVVWSGDDLSIETAKANAQLICDAVNAKCAS